MKRVILILAAVIVCSLSAWCQSSMIVALGTEVIENNTLSSAKVSFRQNYMPLQTMPSGKYGYMSESPLLMAVVDFNGDYENSIKEVDFLCGMAMWYGIYNNLEEAGYSLIEDGYSTLGNGDTVPQKKYSKGSVICLVQVIDKDVKQVIFKRKATKPKPKKKK